MQQEGGVGTALTDQRLEGGDPLARRQARCPDCRVVLVAQRRGPDTGTRPRVGIADRATRNHTLAALTDKRLAQRHLRRDGLWAVRRITDLSATTLAVEALYR